MVKRCWKCQDTKDVASFYKGQSMCKVCAKIRKREYYTKNKEILKEKRRNYYKEVGK